MIAASWQGHVGKIGPTLALLGGFLLAPAAQAQFEQAAVSDEGADAIRLAIKRSLGWFAETLPAEINLVLQGPVEVAVEGETYGAALPALGLRAEDGDDEFELNLGPTLSTIEPLGDNRLAATIDPSEQLVGRRNDDMVFSIDWLTRVAEATFNADFGIPETLNVALTDVKAVNVEQGVTFIDIADMTLDAAYGAASAGRVDGTSSLVANQLRLGALGNEISASRVEIGSDVQEFDVSRYFDYIEFNARMQALSNSGSTLSIDQAETVADELIGFFDIFDGASQQFLVEDFRLVDNTEVGSITRASGDLSISGLTGSQLQIGFAGDVAGLVVPEDASFDPFVPQRMQIDASVVSVPVELLRETVRQVAVGMMSGADRGDINDGLHGQLGKLMGTDAALQLESAIIEFEDSAAFFDGQASFDPSAAFGAVGKASVRLVGLENLIEKTQQLPDGPQIAAFLAFLLAAGQQEQGADDMSVRRYEVEMTAGGTVLLNGADIGPLLQQLN